ncbi:MAG: 50S ribosomal protein L29 [Candidatus Omnitrophota bacterium]
MSLKITELRNMTRDELNQKIAALKVELFNLRFQAETGRIEKPHTIKIIRRDIARIQTILTESETKDTVASRKKA